MIHPIIIPLHHGGGKFKNDTELRFALRSIEKHFKDPFRVVIVGSKLPSWLVGVEHIYGEGLKSSLVAAANAYPEGFIWWYDDNCLTRDITAEEIKVTPACRGWQKPKTGWAKRLDSIRARLEKEGFKAWDYSRPHGPYWFDKAMVDEGFADWPGMKSKFPWESWILSKRDWPRCHGAVKQYYGAFRQPPSANHRYLNYSDGGNTPELRAMLEERFPASSRFESEPLPLSAAPSGSLEVHTLRFGSSWWVRFCGVTLDRWCRDHGYPLRVWKEADINPDYPAAKFCEIDMLREFLKGNAEWCLYVDADVYVHAGAGGFPVGSEKDRFLIRPDRPGKFSRRFAAWCRRRFGAPASAARSWTYRNAGVWACDRKAAERMLAVIAPPWHEGVQEQHQWNWWICLAAKGGMKVADLPHGFNNWPSEETRGSFYHLCGRKKYAKLVALRDRGFIPRDQDAEWEFSPVFDYGKYRFAHCGTTMPMDEYHIHLLHAACRLAPDGGQVAVEIGSYRGASTAALIEAVNLGYLTHLHIVEVKPTASLRQVIALCDFPDRVTLHTKPSWELELPRVDLVFIDGDHKWPAVGDTLRALTWGARVICMHDSRSYPVIPGTWGARMAAAMLREMAGRQVFEDSLQRNGMATHRGFLVSAAAGVDLTPLSEVTCLRVEAVEESAGIDDDDGDEDDPEDQFAMDPDEVEEIAKEELHGV